VTRIAVLGAAGKMGRMIVRAAIEAGATVTAAVEPPGSAHLGSDAGALAGIAPLGVPVGADVSAALAAADVAIDFTAPAASVHTASLATERGTALVVGTTGLSPTETAAIQAAAERVPVVLSSNMSLGVNVLFGLLQKAARALGPGYDVEIVELHHRLKKDSPSGTALSMAHVLADTLGRDLDKVARHGREGLVGARTSDEIGLHAVRGGDVIGEHTAYFFGLGERLELTHRASSRETFARGAVRAATWLAGKPARLYDMQDVLGLRS
jgi:4-hydroxy-tetrahydrodipicolinate reductase